MKTRELSGPRGPRALGGCGLALALLGVLCAAPAAAQDPARLPYLLTDRDIARVVPVMRAEMATISAAERETGATVAEATDYLEIRGRILAGDVEWQTALAARTRYAVVPPGARLALACSRAHQFLLFSFGVASPVWERMRPQLERQNRLARDSGGYDPIALRAIIAEVRKAVGQPETRRVMDAAERFYRARGFSWETGGTQDPLGVHRHGASPDTTVELYFSAVSDDYRDAPGCADLPTGPTLILLYGGHDALGAFQRRAEARAAGMFARAAIAEDDYRAIVDALVGAHHRLHPLWMTPEEERVGLDSATIALMTRETEPEDPEERAAFRRRREREMRNVAVYRPHDAELGPLIESYLKHLAAPPAR